MTSWRPPGSILEAPGLDFGGSWVDFSEIFGNKKTINVKNLPRKDIDHRFARPPKVGGRRWSPPGGFQSAAHRRCAKRARSPAPSLSDTLDPSQLANLKGQAHYAGLGSWSPLFVSPQEGGDHRNPSLNLRLLRLVGPLGSIFCPSQACFKNDFEKTSKKVWKSRILASENPSKIYPKCLPNRCSKKHPIFESIFDNIFQN